VPIPCEEGLTSKLSGEDTITGLFSPWVRKNSVIGEELSNTFGYFYRCKTPNIDLGACTLGIYAYDGEGDPGYAKDESGELLPNFRRVCTLAADMSGLRGFSKVQEKSDGQELWGVYYKIKVLFGGTALKARLTWYEGVSISYFHPQVTDIWLCLSGNPVRRPCRRYSGLSLLDHVCFPSQEDGKFDPMNAFHSASASPLDTIDSVNQLTRGGVGNVLC